MKNVVKSHLSTVAINFFILAIIFYFIYFHPSPDVVFYSDIGVGDYIMVLLFLTFAQLLWLPIIAWPYYAFITKYCRFSPIFSILLGLLIAIIIFTVFSLMWQIFELSAFLAIIGFGLFSGVVFTLFYSSLSRPAKDIQRQ